VIANFFHLGGHSLLAVRLVADIRAQLDHELVVKDIFEATSIRALADKIAANNKLPKDSVNAKYNLIHLEREPNESVITSLAQQRLWVIDQLQDHSAEYNMTAAYRVEGNFCIDIAEQAINRIIKRHATLRTTYKNQGTDTVQVFLNEPSFVFTIQDLSKLDSNAQQEKVNELIANDRLTPFDLSQDLMVRGSYLSLEASIEDNTESNKERPLSPVVNGNVLILTTHHI
jgi:hypothetical protein